MHIIWFSEIKWSYLRTRKQNLIRLFPENWKVLFIEPYVRNKPNCFKPYHDGRVTVVTLPFFKATPFRLLNRLQSMGMIRFAFSEIGHGRVRRIMKKTGFTNPDIVFTSNIYYADIIQKIASKLVVYDCNDYPLGFSNHLPMAGKCFRKTLDAADLVITVSEKLKKDIAELGRSDTHIIGNGVDYELFSSTDPSVVPDELKNRQAPLIFFSGALADWVDMDLIDNMLARYESSTVVLLGPVKDQHAAQAIRYLKKRNNFLYISEKPHELLPSYIIHADICVLPFKKNRRTVGANPNTLYEFLACGKTVVTLDYSDEITALSDYIYVARDDKEFLDFIGRALAEKKDPCILQAVARANSWKSKADTLVRLIEASVVEK